MKVSFGLMHPLLRLWIVMVLAIVVAYFFIDRALCSFIYENHLPQRFAALFHINHWPPVWKDQNGHQLNFLFLMVEWPPILTSLSPLLLLGVPFLKPGKFRDLFILMTLSIMVTFLLKNDLKWVFSRDWPLTWTNNNHSWINNHAYGFQWFQGKAFQANDATGSFPSGHTAVAFACFLPIGLIYRRLLPLCVTIASLEGLAMIVSDYHFLSDVLAGALVGITCTLLIKSVMIPSQTNSDSAVLA